jgi:hypothetical protein
MSIELPPGVFDAAADVLGLHDRRPGPSPPAGAARHGPALESHHVLRAGPPRRRRARRCTRADGADARCRVRLPRLASVRPPARGRRPQRAVDEAQPFRRLGRQQSALIHLPLFAAAAALYGDGHGPRLVMLDEALSGIDDDTRERVLAATVAFDLDLVMTSHELWGTYVSVPSLAIYQLHRQNGTYGVHAIPFLWDGAELREDEQGGLFVA